MLDFGCQNLLEFKCQKMLESTCRLQKPSFVAREALTTAKAIFDYAESDVDIYSDLSAGSGGDTAIIDAFQKLGYDGLIHYDSDGNIKTVITFDSNQFKNLDNENPTSDPDVRKSIRVRYLNGDSDIVEHPGDVSRETVMYYLKLAADNKLNDNTYIPLGMYIPDVIVDSLLNYGEYAERMPMIMSVDELFNRVFKKNKNKNSGKDNTGHDYEPHMVLELLDNLSNPKAILMQPNGRIAVFVDTRNFTDGGEHKETERIESVAIIEFDANIRSNLINDDGDIVFATTVTMFNPDDVVNGEKFDYYEKLISKGAYEIPIINKGDESSANTGKIHPNAENTSPLSENYSTTDGSNSQGDAKKSQRTGETDARTLLSTALSTVAQNDLEKSYIERYQAKISEMNDAQKELSEVSRKLKEISFGTGKRDMDQLRALREQANALRNKINTFDKQLLRLQASEPLKNVVARERALAEKKAKAEFKQWYEGKREQARAREIREKIGKIAHDMQKMLLKPTDTMYVPAELATKIIDVCGLINPLSGDYSTKTAEKYFSMREALLDLKEAYEQHVRDSDDFTLSSEYDEKLSENISLLARTIGDRRIRNLTMEELEDVHTVLNDINKTIRDARKLIDKDERYTAYSAGKDIINMMSKIKSKGLTTGKIEDFFREWTENPMRAVKEMAGFDESSALVQLFNDLNAGRIKADQFSMVSHKKFDALRMDKAGKKAFQEAVENPAIPVRDTTGKEIKISKMQGMQAILTQEREQANKGRGHLATPVKFTDLELEKKGKAVEAFDHGHTVMVDDAFVASVMSQLTPWDLEYMERARQFFRNDSRIAINEVALKIKRRLIASEKAYIPYVVNKDQVKTQSEKVKIDYGIMSAGILKSVKDNASNQIIIRGLNTVVDNHIDEVAKIYGLAIPVRNWEKVFNVRMTDKDGSTYVKEAIRDTWHDGGVKMLDQAVADLQTNRANETVPILNAVKSAFVTSTLASNVSVWMKQAASYPTAGAVLSGSSLRKGLADYFSKTHFSQEELQKLYDEIDAHTPQHYTRRQGLSMIELGEFNQSKGWQNRVNDKLGKLSPMNWIQTMDVATTAALWYASKAEAAKDGHKVGSRQFWKATTEYYNRVLEETQPMYDSLHRAEITKNAGLKNIVMFQTQPIQNSGILRESAMRLKMAGKEHGKSSAQYKKASKQFGMAVGSQLASHFTFTAMTLLAAAILHKMNPWRDKDFELTDESVAKEFAKKFSENVFSAAVPVFGSYAVSIAEKFAGSKYDVVSDSMVDKINESIDNFAKLKEPSFDNFLNVAMDVASYAGIPAKNVYNIVNGARLHAEDFINGEFGSFEAGINRTASQDRKGVYRAITSGDQNAISKYQAKYITPEGDSKYWNLVRTALKENDDRITKAAEARLAGDDATYVRLAREIKAEGHFSQNDIVDAINQVINTLSDDSSPSNTSTKAKSLFSDSDYTDVVEGRSNVSMNEVMDEIVATAVMNGKDYAAAVKQETSDVRSAIKESLQAGNINTSQAIQLLKKHCGMDDAEAKTKTAYWEYMGKNPKSSMTETNLSRYYEEVEQTGITLSTYEQYCAKVKTAKGTDLDGDGKTDAYSKMDAVIKIIDSLPIRADQKTALFLVDYKESNLKRCPW